MIILSALSVVIVLLWNGMFDSISVFYTVESLFFAVYLVGTEVPNYRLQEKENRVYQELLIYFSRVKHRYLSCKHIGNAVIEAAESLSYEIQRLADEIYHVLMESDRKEKVREYILTDRSNRYLKLFLIQAYETSEKGDTFFLENVEHLRLELMEEIYRRKRRAYEFTGYIFVTVAPFFMMPVLKQWGLEFAPELDYFYAGMGGLLETVTFFTTIFIYKLILKAKDISMFTAETKEKLWNIDFIYRNRGIASIIRYLEQSDGKISGAVRRLLLVSGERTSYGKLCFRMVVMACCTCLMLMLFFAETHRKERKTVLESVETMETIAPVASEEKKAMLEKHILSVTEQCKNMPDLSENEIQKLLREKIRLGNENMEQAVVQAIKNKLSQYKKAKISFWEVLLCLLGGGLMGVIPLIKLQFQAKTIRSGAVHEVRQFQSILLMERRLQGITTVGLLEDMEVFSQCFKNSLRKCINAYGAGPERALIQLKEEGSMIHEGFEELADAFLSIDEVGIELAFAEVESNRRLLEKLTQLEAEISMERKKDSADIIAKIPMVLAVGVYFILPFFVYSLQGVYEVFDILEGMQV